MAMYSKTKIRRYSISSIPSIIKSSQSENDPVSYTDSGVLRLTYYPRWYVHTTYDFLQIKKHSLKAPSLWNKCNTPENRRRY